MCLYRWGQLDSSAFYIYIFVIVIKYSMLVMSTAVAHDNYYGRFPHQNKDGHARRQGCATDCVPPFITHVPFSSIYPNKIQTKNFSDHGYIVSGVRATDDGVVGSATVASADAPLVASGGLTATAAASAAPAVHFKTGAHPIKGNLMVVEFAGGAK